MISTEEILTSLAAGIREGRISIDELEHQLQAFLSERSQLANAAQYLCDILRDFPNCGRAAFGDLNCALLEAANSRCPSQMFTRFVSRPSLWEIPKMAPPTASAPVVLVRTFFIGSEEVRREIKLLEKSSMSVRGVVALVGSSHSASFRELSAIGYSVRIAMDVATSDPTWPERGLPITVTNCLTDEDQFLNGLAPHKIARIVAQRVLDGGRVPGDPRVLDREYDNAGGTVIRIREQITRRLLAESTSRTRSIVSTVADLVLPLRGSLQNRLDKTAFEVLFLSEPKACRFIDLSNEDGFIIAADGVSGFSRPILPDEYGCANLFERYQLAASLLAPEKPGQPYHFSIVRRSDDEDLRHGWIDPPWRRSVAVGESLTRTARAILESQAEAKVDALRVLGIPVECVNSVAVTLFHNGVLGCGTAWAGSLEARLADATRLAASDPRFVCARSQHPKLETITIGVTVLFDGECLGEHSIMEASKFIRRGLDAFSVCKGDQFAVFLESVIPEQSWTSEEACAKLATKAQLQLGPFTWSRYATASWTQGPSGTNRCCCGFADRGEQVHETNFEADITSLANFIASQIGDDGLPTYCIYPVTGFTRKRGDLGRSMHALLALAECALYSNRADWMDASRQGFRRCFQHIEIESNDPQISVPGWPKSSIAAFDLLVAAPYLSEAIQATQLASLAAALCRWVRPDGRVAAPNSQSPLEEEHDVLPGFVLNALACYMDFDGQFDPAFSWDSSFQWYRRRFHLTHPWGMLGWQPHVWARVASRRGMEFVAEFVFEMLDWAIEHQLQDGSFLLGLGVAGPSFQTGYIAESVAAGWKLAQQLHDGSRSHGYCAAWESACRFMRRLVIRSEDTPVMKMGASAIGGVRLEESSAEVRIDYVSHTLRALVAGRSLQGQQSQL